MSEVFVERRWNAPVTAQDMQGLMAMAAGCLGLHRVEWLGSLLSSDGMDMFCHFRGPDAESVRIAIAQPGSAPPPRAWACTVHDEPGVTEADLMRANVMVGHGFDAPAEFGAREVRDGIEMGCLRIHRVRLLRRYRSADRRRVFSLYHAPDAESVRLAGPEAGLPPDRIWAVRRYAP